MSLDTSIFLRIRNTRVCLSEIATYYPVDSTYQVRFVLRHGHVFNIKTEDHARQKLLLEEVDRAISLMSDASNTEAVMVFNKPKGETDGE